MSGRSLASGNRIELRQLPSIELRIPNEHSTFDIRYSLNVGL
jgi:hypothetical protein